MAGLVGKTEKMKSVSPGYVLAPRVTQVRQILSSDIIFVKKVAFLLGLRAYPPWARHCRVSPRPLRRLG